MDDLTRRAVLPNGVTLLVRELHTAPVVTLNLWVGTGARDDPDGLAGVAHFIEHMLFGGRGGGGAGGALVNGVLDVGGHLNGETGCDGTTFYQIVPAAAWRSVLASQATAIAGACFSEDAVEAERSVIIEEARGAERQPPSFLWHRLMERAFPEDPCRRPVLGTEVSLARTGVDELSSHFADHYRGGNLVQVVCGDVETEAVIEAAHLSFEALPSGARPPRTPTTDEKQHGDAFGYVGDIDRAYVYIAHRVPPALHDDLPALDVMSGLLGLGRSSRLRQRLQTEAGLVSTIDSGVVAYRSVGLHVIRAVTGGQAVEDVVRETTSELERLASDGVSPREMEKNLRRLESAYALEHETSDSIARTLGHYETLGDYRLAEQTVDRLAAVTADDVRRVAGAYLAGGATVVSYAPAGSGAPEGAWRPEPPQVAEQRGPRVAEGAAAYEATCGFTRPTLIGESSAPVCGREELPSGAVLVTCVSRAVPVASVAVSFRGGHAEESDDLSGITYLTQKALLRGTRRLPAALLAEEIEALGSGIGTAVDRDGFGIGTTVLSTRLPATRRLLTEILTQPSFAPEQVELARSEVLAEIGEINDDPMRRALMAALPLVLPEHPYGRSVRGTPETLERIGPAELRNWHAGTHAASRMVVCGAGDVSNDELRDVASLPRAKDVPAAAPEPTRRPSGEAIVETPGAHQSSVLVAFLGPPVGTEESVALRVASRGLGMMGGPLWRELRERPPHAYSVGAGVFQFASASVVVGHATAGPGREEAVRDALIASFEGLAERGLERDDLARARRSSAGAYEIALQRGAARAVACSMAEILGTGYERVFRTAELLRRVTGERIVEAASRYLTRECGVSSVLVRGGDQN